MAPYIYLLLSQKATYSRYNEEMNEQPEEFQFLPAEPIDDDTDDEADVFNLDDSVLTLPEILEEEPHPDELAIPFSIRYFVICNIHVINQTFRRPTAERTI